MKLYVLKNGVYHFNKYCQEYPETITEDMVCSVDVPKGAKLCNQCESHAKFNDDGYFDYELYFTEKYRQ
ncbi:MAG: hypothetical protein MJE63_09005, partial [Proteobacteria bacterium]|nr:hypothetical protein [Pseudomonadota bacterium]